MPAGFNKKKFVAVGYSKGRVILQTFDKSSLPLLHQYMPDVPICFLLWLDDGAMASTTPNAKPSSGQSLAEFRATLQVAKSEFEKWIVLKYHQCIAMRYTTPMKKDAVFEIPHSRPARYEKSMRST